MSYHSLINVRSLLAILGFTSALFAPWWVPLMCMVFLALRYPSWEVLMIGLLIDLTWLPAEGISLPLFTIGGIALVWVCMPLRRQFLT